MRSSVEMTLSIEIGTNFSISNFHMERNGVGLERKRNKIFKLKLSKSWY